VAWHNALGTEKQNRKSKNNLQFGRNSKTAFPDYKYKGCAALETC